MLETTIFCLVLCTVVRLTNEVKNDAVMYADFGELMLPHECFVHKTHSKKKSKQHLVWRL